VIMGTSHEIMLDPDIRNWVLIPIVLIMFLMGILRNNVTKMLRKDVPPNVTQVAHNNQLMRARRLRANAAYIPNSAFTSRKHYFCDKSSGVLVAQKFDAPNPMAAMQDPSVMMNMMQGNMAQMVPQMAMMGMVNYFFSGFVLGKIPFPLTPSFKGMLQRGISLTTLDTAYVTSMSWYFLVMFGMRGLYSLVMGSAGPDDMAMMQAQMGMGQQGQPGQQPDFGKLYAAEAENMQIVEHVWFLDAAEERLLKSKSATTSTGAAAGAGAAAKPGARKKRD